MNSPWWYVMTDLSTTPYNTFKSLAACSRANFSFCFSRNILQADFNRFSFNSAVTSSILLTTSPKKIKIKLKKFQTLSIFYNQSYALLTTWFHEIPITNFWTNQNEFCLFLIKKKLQNYNKFLLFFWLAWKFQIWDGELN